MIIEVDTITQIMIAGCGSALGALLIYIAVRVMQIYVMTKLHDRMIFGEEGVDGWDGILKMCLREVRRNEEIAIIVEELIKWQMRQGIKEDKELVDLYARIKKVRDP